MPTKIIEFITGTAVITAFAALFAYSGIGWVAESQDNAPHAPYALVKDLCEQEGYQSDACIEWAEINGVEL